MPCPKIYFLSAIWISSICQYPLFRSINDSPKIHYIQDSSTSSKIIPACHRADDWYTNYYQCKSWYFLISIPISKSWAMKMYYCIYCHPISFYSFNTIYYCILNIYKIYWLCSNTNSPWTTVTITCTSPLQK